jgi:hypothetical protein
MILQQDYTMMRMHSVHREFMYCIVFVTPVEDMVQRFKRCIIFHLQSSAPM